MENEIPSKDDEESQHTDVSENEPEDTHNEQLYRTRYGRAVQQYVPFTPMAATADISAMISEINVMATELNMLKSQNDEEQNFEFSLVGATGQGFENTSELRVMTYKEAIQEPDAAEWQKEIDKEHARMMQHKAWIAVPRSDVPKGTKILGSTWAMKRKANGTRRARLNTKGCSQRPGLHYDEDNISSSVTNLTSKRIAFILMVMAQDVILTKPKEYYKN
jgi:hypothetical protein